MTSKENHLLREYEKTMGRKQARIILRDMKKIRQEYKKI